MRAKVKWSVRENHLDAQLCLKKRDFLSQRRWENFVFLSPLLWNRASEVMIIWFAPPQWKFRNERITLRNHEQKNIRIDSKRRKNSFEATTKNAFRQFTTSNINLKATFYKILLDLEHDLYSAFLPKIYTFFTDADCNLLTPTDRPTAQEELSDLH